jgi:hypothetical protein
MKSRMMCLVVPFVLLSASLSSAQTPSRYQQVYEVAVRPGQELVYENYVKKLVAAADKAGAKTYWTSYVVTLGKPSPTYRVALNFNSWADRDAWATIPGMLAKAYGQPEAERLMKEGSSAIERSVIEVWENQPGASANTGGTVATIGNVVRAQIVRVDPAKVADYEAMTVKFKPAYDAAAGKPVITRSVLRVGANSGYTFRRVQQVSTMSELDGPTGPELLQKFFGAQWAAMGAELNAMVTFRQEFISARRADLSRRPPATTSSR